MPPIFLINYSLHLLRTRIVVKFPQTANHAWMNQRSHNNKGNIMDSFLLAIAETCNHELLWTILWATFMHQHCGSNFKWLALHDAVALFGAALPGAPKDSAFLIACSKFLFASSYNFCQFDQAHQVSHTRGSPVQNQPGYTHSLNKKDRHKQMHILFGNHPT